MRFFALLAGAGFAVLQELSKNFFGVKRFYIPLVPVLFFGYLCVEKREVFSDEFSFFFSDFIDCIVVFFAFGVVKNIKLYGFAFSLKFLKNTVFEFASAFDSDIMSCDSVHHIQALANVNNLLINLYAINASVLIFLCQALATEHFSDIVLIGIYLITSFFIFYKYYNIYFL